MAPQARGEGTDAKIMNKQYETIPYTRQYMGGNTWVYICNSCYCALIPNDYWARKHTEICLYSEDKNC